MKKVLSALFALALASCVPSTGSTNASLTSPEGLKDAQALLADNFAKYDGKIVAVGFSVDADDHIDMVDVTYKEGSKATAASYVVYTKQVIESNPYAGLEAEKGLKVSDFKVTELTSLVDKAKALIAEKDKNFTDFRAHKLEYEVQADGSLLTRFVVYANNANTSYFGKRVDAGKPVFAFSFEADTAGNVKAVSGLEL